MDQVQAQRLLNVAKALRESKSPEKFSMCKYLWGERGNMGIKEESFCGTPACALGHYAARADLQDFIKIVFTTTTSDTKQYARVAYKDGANFYYDDRAVRDHFGIDFEAAERLFAPDGCGEASTAIEAAEYIEDFVKQNSRG